RITSDESPTRCSLAKDCLAGYPHQIKERSNRGTHDEVTVTAELDKRKDDQQRPGDDPTRILPTGWSEHQPENPALKEKEAEKFIEWQGLESARLGGSVGGKEDS